MPADHRHHDGPREPHSHLMQWASRRLKVGATLLVCALAACGGSDPPPADESRVPNTPLKWDAGTWDQARWQ